MASIIPENSTAGSVQTQSAFSSLSAGDAGRAERTRSLVDGVRHLRDVPNSLPAAKVEARTLLLTGFTAHLSKGDLPLARSDFERSLKRVAHRIAHSNEQGYFEDERASQTLVTQLMTEAQLAQDLGFTAREVALSLHKMTLSDYVLLQDNYPKMIVERALTRPDPVEAARELANRREEHKTWVTKHLAEGEEASIASLVASKSFRLREKPQKRFYHVRRLYRRFQRDRAWFERSLPEEFHSGARHFATRTFYLPANHRHRVVRDLRKVSEAFRVDPRVEQYKLRFELIQRSVGVASNPVKHIQGLLDNFEREYRVLRALLPGRPQAVYRGLAIRAGMTSSSDHAEQVGVAHGREPIPIASDELAERYQRYAERYLQFPTINWLLALDMTLSSKPEERLRSHLDTFRESLGLTGKGIEREPLLGAIENTFHSYPESQRGFIRRGLLGRFTTLQPTQLHVFSEFRNRIQQELLPYVQE